jgi:hypothetical protein
MKKILGVIFLSLLLQGCVTVNKVGESNNLLNENEFQAVVHMQPDSDSVPDILPAMATLGIISPKFYDFYAYAKTAEEAEKKAMELCLKFRTKKGWDKDSTVFKKAHCTGRKAKLTTKGKEEKVKTEKVDALASMIDKAKNNCKALGFEEGTGKFTDCTLKLYTQEVENKVALKVAEQKSSNSSNSGTMTIYDPVRDSQNQIDRGMKMLSGGCTLGIDC